jgi:hypothetical protein
MDSLADRHYEPIYRFTNLRWLVLLQQDEMKMPNMFDFFQKVVSRLASVLNTQVPAGSRSVLYRAIHLQGPCRAG